MAKQYTVEQAAKVFVEKNVTEMADIMKRFPYASMLLFNSNESNLELFAALPENITVRKLDRYRRKCLGIVSDEEVVDDNDETEAVEEEIEKKSKKEKKEEKVKKEKKRTKKEVNEEDEDEDEDEVKPKKTKKAKKVVEDDDDDDFDFDD